VLDLKCSPVEPVFVSAAASRRPGSTIFDRTGFASLTVWHMKTWKPLTVLPLGEDPPAITSVCFNHNGKILAASATDGMIHMFGILFYFNYFINSHSASYVYIKLFAFDLEYGITTWCIVCMRSHINSLLNCTKTCLLVFRSLDGLPMIPLSALFFSGLLKLVYLVWAQMERYLSGACTIKARFFGQEIAVGKNMWHLV
jgi:hypothetical protein